MNAFRTAHLRLSILPDSTDKIIEFLNKISMARVFLVLNALFIYSVWFQYVNSIPSVMIEIRIIAIRVEKVIKAAVRRPRTDEARAERS